MSLDTEYTYDPRSPEERAPCRCAECEAAGECERRNVALVAELRAALEITEGTVRELRAWTAEAIPYVEFAMRHLEDEAERERVYELLTRPRP